MFCASLGSDPLLTQASGGNVSCKEGRTLWVKASGTRLADALERDIFLPVELTAVLDRLAAGLENLADLSFGGQRPSMETFFHAVLPQKIVLHLHLLDAVIHSARLDSFNFLKEALHGFDWGLIQYAKPGLALGQSLETALRSSAKNPNVFILQNHGIILAGESWPELRTLLNNLRERLWLAPRPMPLADLATLDNVNDLGWSIPTAPEPHFPAFEEAGYKMAESAPLFPDQVVFLGPTPFLLSGDDKLSLGLAKFTAGHGYEPRFVMVKNAGILLSSKATAGVQATLEALGLICARTKKEHDLRGLSQADVQELSRFEAEAWRLNQDV